MTGESKKNQGGEIDGKSGRNKGKRRYGAISGIRDLIDSSGCDYSEKINFETLRVCSVVP
jgi:hypothetical protein